MQGLSSVLAYGLQCYEAVPRMRLCILPKKGTQMTRTQFYYKNHRGVTELRSIEPISLQYVASPHLEYGYAPGWFLHGLDFTERDGVARKGEPRSFALTNIQMEGFKHGTKGGAAAFRLMLVPVEPFPLPLYENHREPGEFGEGATVKVTTPVDAPKPDLGTTVLPIARSAVDEILKK